MKFTSSKHNRYLLNSLNSLFFINIPFKAMLSTLWATLVYYTGNEPKILEFITILLICDLFMGILAAIKHKTLSSDFLVQILYKAAMYLVLLVTSAAFVGMCPYGWVIRDIFRFLIGSAEVISILENADLLGFKYAKRVIECINKEVDKKLNKN